MKISIYISKLRTSPICPETSNYCQKVHASFLLLLAIKANVSTFQVESFLSIYEVKNRKKQRRPHKISVRHAVLESVKIID